MLTAFAICWFFSETAITYPFTEATNFIFLILFALVLDYGIWTLGDS